MKRLMMIIMVMIAAFFSCKGDRMTSGLSESEPFLAVGNNEECSEVYKNKWSNDRDVEKAKQFFIGVSLLSDGKIKIFKKCSREKMRFYIRKIQIETEPGKEFGMNKGGMDEIWIFYIGSKDNYDNLIQKMRENKYYRVDGESFEK